MEVKKTPIFALAIGLAVFTLVLSANIVLAHTGVQPVTKFGSFIINSVSPTQGVTNDIDIKAWVTSKGTYNGCGFHNVPDHPDFALKHEWQTLFDISDFQYRIKDKFTGQIKTQNGWRSVLNELLRAENTPNPETVRFCKKVLSPQTIEYLTYNPDNPGIVWDINPKSAVNGNLAEDGKTYVVEMQAINTDGSSFRDSFEFTMAGGPAAKPDLVISALSASDSAPTVGQSITFTATEQEINNNGADPGANVLRFTVDGATLSDHDVDPPPGGSRTRTSSAWTATAGSHTVEACADATNVVDESKENNNCRSITITVAAPVAKPDLTISSLTAPSGAKAGDSLTFTATESELNNVNPAANILRFTVDGPTLSDHNVNPPAGGSLTRTSIAWTATAGSHTVEACADADNQVPESNETHASNCKSAGFTVAAAAQPNLHINDWSRAAELNQLVEGDMVKFKAAGINDGTACAGSPFGFGYRLDGALFHTEGAAALCPGDARVFKFSKDWVATRGPHTFQAKMDENNSVAESNENDNLGDLVRFNVAAAPAPVVDLSANPLLVDYDGSTLLTWTVSGGPVDSCEAYLAWAGPKSKTGGSQTISNIQSPKDYGLRCTGPGGVGDAQVHVDVKRPTANLSANPNPIASGTSSTLTWTSTNANSCSINWFDDSLGPSGQRPTGSLTADRTYLLTCYGHGAGSDSETVVVSAVEEGEPPEAPTNLRADNSTCQQIALTWTDNADDENGFFLYRNTTGGTNLANYTRIDTLPANRTSATDSPSAGAAYHYALTSYTNIGGESAPAFAGPVFNNACAPNFSLSSKVVESINGTAYSGQTIQNGDTIRFRIVISNVGNTTGYDVYITDTLSANLTYAGNPTLNGNSITASVSGQTITFDAGQNLGDKAADGTNWLLRFDATVNTNSQQAVDFVANDAAIRYSLSNNGPQDQTHNVTTGPVPVRTGSARVPTIREIAP